MKIRDSRCRISWLLFLMCAALGIFFITTQARAGLEEEFTNASNLGSYRGDIANKNSRLIQNTTRALHKENMEILKEIKELKEEISELKKIIAGL